MNPDKPIILIVEDEPNLARGIRENLEAEGYSVETAVNGRVALERVRREEFGLLILDVMLPGMDGFTLCQTLRAEGRDTPEERDAASDPIAEVPADRAADHHAEHARGEHRGKGRPRQRPFAHHRGYGHGQQLIVEAVEDDRQRGSGDQELLGAAPRPFVENRADICAHVLNS